MPNRTEKAALAEDWRLYEEGKSYNHSLDLYSKVNLNERFYRGDQWEGIASGGLPTPVFNLFRRIINYYISNLLSSAVAMRYTFDSPYGDKMKITAEQAAGAVKKLNDIALHRWKKLYMDDLLSSALYDAAITGDAVAYTFWDPTVKTGQSFTGDFRTVLLDNTNVFFGNPNSKDVKSQPYILIASRELVEDVKAVAAGHGRSKEEIALITGDSDSSEFAGDMAQKELTGTKCVTLTKLWRGENGTICFRKSVRDTVITETVDTGLQNYPICFFNWTPIKKSWHGQAVATGMIENQIFINKAFAMVMKHMMDTAFSKVVYDSTIIDEWSNRIGEAVAVSGPVENVAKVLSPGQMQTGMLDVINLAIAHTKEFLGATDTALGDVKPTNTSAILALQQAATQPLECIRRALYRFVADIGMVWLDFMLTYYDDSRLVCVPEGTGERYQKFDFSPYREVLFDCEVDAGASSYWSEISALNTLDNLLINGKIDTIQYLERIPDKLIPKKEALISEIKAAVERVQQTMQNENGKDESIDEGTGI